MEPEQDCSEWSSDDESDESLCEEIIDDYRTLETILVCVNVWSAFVTSNIPATHCREQGLALQILLDRIVKKLIANKAASKQQGLQHCAMFNSLTMFESNAIRYMAGFVAVKKFRRCTMNDAVQHKHKLFVKALQGMKATPQPEEPDSVLEYSTLWMELIDRGGLYHINYSVFEIFQSIDLLLRQALQCARYADVCTRDRFAKNCC